MDMNETVNINKKAKRLSISRIYPGMVTARDVYARNDQLVISKGIVLDSIKISKLLFYAVESVYVYLTDDSRPEKESYNDELRNSMEFRQFVQNYDEAVMSVKEHMNSIIEKNASIDQDEVLFHVNHILRKSKNKLQLLNMLYCIRNYDDSTYMHSVNVALLCNVFADWLQYDREDKELLTLSGLLHDIGKTQISIDVLNKPGKLTNEEYEIIKQHTLKGYEILKDKDVDERVKRAVLYHHERYDGSGYNSRIIGEEIDAFAMVVAVADVYDAMTSSRVYRGPICPFDVIHSFENDGYQIYNPKILIPLVQNIAESYTNHAVRLNNEKEGEVIVINRADLSKPIVKLSDNSIIDLSKDRNVLIKEIL